MPTEPSPRRAQLIIALVSCAVLLYEIAITRLLSVVVWYHFAFLAISLAMLGLGAPGVWLALRGGAPPRLGRWLIAAGVAIPASIATVIRLPEWIPRASFWALFLEGESSIKVTLLVATILVPLLLLGTVVCRLLMTVEADRLGRLYAADLAGAAAGAIAVVPLMHLVPTPTLLAATGFLPLAAARLAGARGSHVALAAGLLAASLVTTHTLGSPYRVRYNKVHSETEYNVLFERWTPTARIAVYPSLFWQAQGPQYAFGWGMGSRFRGAQIEQLWIEQDGWAGTPITRFEGAASDLEHLMFDVTSVAHQLRPPRSVCVIGAGGGRDILTALAAGAERIDAVELNPAIVAAVSEEFRELSGDVYHRPEVTPYVSEGRAFLTAAADRRYDLLQISLIDSWAATTAGAYTLSESYLYTVEAMHLYLSRLSESGVLTVSRWMDGQHQLETVRLVLLAERALAVAGIERPTDHMALIQGGQVGNLLISRQPFAASDIVRLDTIARQRGFRRHWPVPTRSRGADSELHPAVAALLGDTERLRRDGIWLQPPTDERPFFFQSLRAFDRTSPELIERLSLNDQAARLPRRLIAAVFAITAALFLAPLVLWRRLGSESGSGELARGCGYFLAIGCGFMLVEVPLIQRFVLYLGHPSYATTVVLATMLLGTGLGSWAAGHLPAARLDRLRLLPPLAVALAAVVGPPLLGASLGWPLPARVASCAAALLPLGFLLGFPFPIGMRRFASAPRAWLWAVNGSASVLASVAYIALAAYIGVSGVLWSGVLAYLIAGALLPTARSDAQTP